MKNNITELVFILDKSGSMAGLEGDTVGGFNSLIEKQKKEEGNAYITAVLFDNDSKFLYDRVELKKKEIEKRKEDGWEFLFLGANIDAVEVAGNIGISRERAVEYKCDSRGTKLNYSVLSRAISSVRECSAVNDNWKAEIEEDIANRK